jgi:integrase
MGVKVRKHHGSYYCFVNFQGRRKAIKFATEKEAKLAAPKLEAGLQLNRFNLTDEPETPPVTLRQFAIDEWLPQASIRENTIKLYHDQLTYHILPELGSSLVKDLTRERIRRFLTESRDTGRAAGSVRASLATLRACLSYAVERELIPTNPASKQGKHCRKPGTPKAEIQPLSEAESTALLDKAGALRTLLLVALRTGLRQGELLGLRWADVDLTARTLTVRHSLTNGKLTAPKSGKTRQIDLAASVVEALSTIENQSPERYVFPRRSVSGVNSPMDAGNLRAHFKRLIKRAGLRRSIRFHDLRHTTASRLLKQRADLHYVSKMLGHSQTSITLDVYSHFIPPASNQHAWVDGLDK